MDGGSIAFFLLTIDFPKDCAELLNLRSSENNEDERYV
jgi:hypothetical protein